MKGIVSQSVGLMECIVDNAPLCMKESLLISSLGDVDSALLGAFVSVGSDNVRFGFAAAITFVLASRQR